jgi:rsbT antagonist protein RsbS
MKPYSIFPLEDTLLVSIQEEIGDEGVSSLFDEISALVKVRSAAGVIIDLHAVEVVDSFLAGSLAKFSTAQRLLHTKVVVVGLAVPVVITLLDFGIQMKGVEFALDVEQAQERLGHRPAAQP